MNRQSSNKIRPSRCLAATLMIAGMLLHCVGAVAQDARASQVMTQPATGQTTAPVQPAASSTPTNAGHRSKSRKAEIGTGFFLFGVGVVTIAAAALLNSSGGVRPSGAKTPALYAAGAGSAAIGITLISFGFHRHRAK
jgi:hypothetical protein